MIVGFAHPAIVVTDLDQARDFYNAMFGFSVVDVEGWDSDNELYNQAVGLKRSAARGYVLAGQNCFLELWEFIAPDATTAPPAELGANETGIRHLCFFTDDIWSDFQRLQDLGGYAMNEPVGNDEIGYAVYCRDPFGNIIELSTEGGTARHLHELPNVTTN